MNRAFLCLCMLVGLMWNVTAQSDEDLGRRVVLLAAGGVDPELLERVRAFCVENTTLDLDVGETLEGDFTTLNEIADAASQALTESDAFVVVLSSVPTGELAHGSCLHDRRVAVVNMVPLLADDPDAERLGRRAERGVMQSIGMLVDMSSCPNPQCVLWGYSTIEELDAKGRNFCPPCYERFLSKARAQGLRFIEREYTETAE